MKPASVKRLTNTGIRGVGRARRGRSGGKKVNGEYNHELTMKIRRVKLS